MSDPVSLLRSRHAIELRLQRRKFLLGEDEIGVVVGREGSHAFNLHLLGHDLAAQDGGGFDQRSRLTVNLQNAGRLLSLASWPLRPRSACPWPAATCCSKNSRRRAASVIASEAESFRNSST